MFYIPWTWSGPSLSNFGHPDIFTSARALVWSPFHRHPWSAFNSFSSVFLHPVCVTGSRNPWAFFQATASALGPPQRPPNVAFQITLSRPWAGGPVMHINSTLEPQWNQFWKFLGGYFSNRYFIKRGSVHLHISAFGFGR